MILHINTFSILNCLKFCVHFTQTKTYEITEKDIETVFKDNNYIMLGSGYVA